MNKFKKILLSGFLFGLFAILMVGEIGFVQGQELSQGPITGPISTPWPNHPPKISPRDLPRAVLNRFSYSGIITIIDEDYDAISVKYEGTLPKGLRFGDCPKNGIGTIECYILGIPRETGKFKIKVTAVDSQGATTIQEVILTVVSR